MQADIAKSADFTGVRYAQCWEDADVLLAGLDIRPGNVCLSIASAGDNVMAMLSRNPARVVALDLSPAQIACLELRVAAYRALDHAGLLELIGSRPSGRREELYRRCRGHLSGDARRFWDARPADIAMGIGSAGKFERYLSLFRRRVLPLIHSHRLVGEYLEAGDEAARALFYDKKWDCWRWRAIFRLFFSRFLFGPAREFRDDPRQPGPPGMAARVAGSLSRRRRRQFDRPFQSQRRLRIHVERGLPSPSRIPRPLRPPEQPAGLLEPRGDPSAAGRHGGSAAATDRSGGPAARAGQGVLLWRLRG
jgi:hypothetical protein